MTHLWRLQQDIFKSKDSKLVTWLVTVHACPLVQPGLLFLEKKALGLLAVPCFQVTMEHNCGSSLALLEAKDGHEHCGACLGLIHHLWEALTDKACMNCSIILQSVRLARLAQLDPLASLPSLQPANAHSTKAPAQKRPAAQCQAWVPVKSEEGPDGVPPVT